MVVTHEKKLHARMEYDGFMCKILSALGIPDTITKAHLLLKVIIISIPNIFCTLAQELNFKDKEILKIFVKFVVEIK